MKIKMYEVYICKTKQNNGIFALCTCMYNMNFHDTYIHMYNASLVEKYIQFITRSVNREDDKIGKY